MEMDFQHYQLDSVFIFKGGGFTMAGAVTNLMVRMSRI
jgi:hypothetical protein